MCCLHLPAQLGDQALRRLGEQLRERERGDGLNRRWPSAPRAMIGSSRCPCRLDSTPSTKGFDDGGQHQAADAVDDHQHEAQRQQPAPRPDELPHLRPRLSQLRLRRRAGVSGAIRVARAKWCAPLYRKCRRRAACFASERLCPRASRRNKGAHAQQHEDQAENAGRRLHLSRHFVHRKRRCLRPRPGDVR